MTATKMTDEQLKAKAVAVVRMVAALGDTIRELGEAPEGYLYAAFMGHGIGLEGFTRMVDLLVAAGLVERVPGNILRWVGPDIQPKSGRL